MYYFAGRYEELLKFEFEGSIISAEPEGLRPGDDWGGPHVGIPYTLAAGGNDFYYKVESRPSVEKQVYLSSVVGDRAAADLARRLGRYKGEGGGRVYINEARHFFMPLYRQNQLRYIYAGPLGEDDWFPEPLVPEGW